MISNSETNEMTYLTKTALLLALVSYVNAGVFDKSFLVRMEDITETNRQCKQTVTDQNSMMANLTSVIQNQGETIKNQGETIQNQGETIEVLKSSVEAMNSTLSTMQNGNFHMHVRSTWSILFKTTCT